MRSFVEIKPWRNVEMTQSFSYVGKSGPSCNCKLKLNSVYRKFFIYVHKKSVCATNVGPFIKIAANFSVITFC